MFASLGMMFSLHLTLILQSKEEYLFLCHIYKLQDIFVDLPSSEVTAQLFRCQNLSYEHISSLPSLICLLLFFKFFLKELVKSAL